MNYANRATAGNLLDSRRVERSNSNIDVLRKLFEFDRYERYTRFTFDRTKCRNAGPRY